MQIVKEAEALRNPDGKVVRLIQEITCQTTNVVYAVSCKQYDWVIHIGETGTTVYQRTMNHLSSIRNNRHGTPLAKHFNKEGPTIDDFKITGVEVPREDSVVYRRLREMVWIKRMKTMENGENKKQ